MTTNFDLNPAAGEPVTEQAPAVDTTSTTQATPATTPGLPDGYLSGGYYATTDKGDKYLPRPPRRLSLRRVLRHHRQGGQVSPP